MANAILKDDSLATIGHWIGGKSFAGTSERFGRVFDPATGKCQAQVALAGDADVAAAVAAAASAFAGMVQNPRRQACAESCSGSSNCSTSTWMSWRRW